MRTKLSIGFCVGWTALMLWDFYRGSSAWSTCLLLAIGWSAAAFQLGAVSKPLNMDIGGIYGEAKKGRLKLTGLALAMQWCALVLLIAAGVCFLMR